MSSYIFTRANDPGLYSLRPVGDRPPRGRGGGRGGRGGRGRGIGRSDGFDSRGKREFDRHSGNDKSSVNSSLGRFAQVSMLAIVSLIYVLFSSSQKADEKRGGAGSHNWGNTKEEAR